MKPWHELPDAVHVQPLPDARPHWLVIACPHCRSIAWTSKKEWGTLERTGIAVCKRCGESFLYYG